MRTTVLVSLLAVLCLGATPVRERARATDVHITFAGVITHVLDAAHPARAVTLRGEGHMAHRATLFVRASSVLSTDVAMSCDNDGTCAIALDGLRVALANAAGRPAFDAGGSFDRFVPHLRAITGGMTLADDVHAEVPRGAVGAIFELPGGVYSATPHEDRAMFVPDREGRGARTMSREVFLTTRVASPELRFSNGKSLRFRDDGLIELRITNEPAHNGDGHFKLHYELAAQIVERPFLASISTRPGISLINSECSNTQWP